METPTLMETLRHGNTHAQTLSVTITPHQCFSLSPFDINGKGYLSGYLSPFGVLPLTELSLGILPLSALPLSLHHHEFIYLSPFDKGLTPPVDMSPPDIVPSLTNHGKNNSSPCGYVSPVCMLLIFLSGFSLSDDFPSLQDVELPVKCFLSSLPVLFIVHWCFLM
jgi:hypothetical protein